MGDRVGWLSLLIREDVPGDTAVAEVLRLQSPKSVHPDDPRGFGHWSMAEMHEEMTTVFSAFRWVSFVFGGLALFAGVIGIMNIMLITIKERTRELGAPGAWRHPGQHRGPNHGRDVDPHRACGAGWRNPGCGHLGSAGRVLDRL